MYGSSKEGIEAINKWKQQIWNNFFFFLLWTTTDDYAAVNHHPKAIVDGDKSLKCINKIAQTGDRLTFDASRSSDPDHNTLNYKWTVYPEPGTYKGTVHIENDTVSVCHVPIPSDASGKTIHLILEVTDNGIPSLTAYRRVVIRVL